MSEGPLGEKEVARMVRKSEVTTLSIYIPKSKLDRKPIERLDRLAKKLDRSINYLVVEAIVQYLDREEKRK
jgi:predicted transcriptional regulator